jgi:hypothetical protein
VPSRATIGRHISDLVIRPPLAPDGSPPWFSTRARSRTGSAGLAFVAQAIDRSPPKSRKEARSMAAQTHYLETDLLGAFPALLLVLVLILTALGVLAHAAFA